MSSKETSSGKGRERRFDRDGILEAQIREHDDGAGSPLGRALERRHEERAELGRRRIVDGRARWVTTERSPRRSRRPAAREPEPGPATHAEPPSASTAAMLREASTSAHSVEAPPTPSVGRRRSKRSIRTTTSAAARNTASRRALGTARSTRR